MADNPQIQSSPPESGAETSSQSSAKGAIANYLPLIIAVVVMPLAAWLVIEFKSGGSSGSPPPAESDGSSEESSASAHAAPANQSSNRGKTISGRNPRIPVPLTQNYVMYVERDKTKANDFDKIVVADHKGETKDIAQPTDIIANIAGTGGSRYIVTRISIIGRDPDLVEKINESRELLIDKAQGLISSKTLEQISNPAFRTLLKSELVELFNGVLGAGTVQEVVITRFATQ